MIIRREALQAAMAAATSDDTRYFLQAVQVDPAKHTVVATDGHVLLVCTDTNPEKDAEFPAMPEAPFHGNPTKPVLIPVDVVNSLLKTMPKKPTIPILGMCQLSQNGTGESATVAATDLQVRNVARLQDEGRKFPAWERAMPPADRESVTVAIGVTVLEAIIKAAKAIHRAKGSTGPVIQLNIPLARNEVGELEPVVVSALGVLLKGEDVTVTGAAMPCRV